jgi:cation diffusion facilitator CzcD-associated flavoprotein CzcO
MGSNSGSGPDLAFISQKYEEEKLKRIRPDAGSQYVDLELSSSSRLHDLVEDPWVDHDALNAKEPNLKEGDDIKFLLLGGGFCSLQFAVYFIKAGFKPEDIRFVDTAGGFGGTWYWNRYPGLMCDTESSIYLPFLEETGYRPTHRYSYGPDIRLHAERIAEHYKLSDKGVFRSYMKSFAWDNEKRRWVVTIKQNRGPKEEPVSINVTAQFVVLANGVLNHPKAPKIDGFETFEGKSIHTGRWRYDISGGSPTDWTLSGLKGKKVGFIGTGATGVQCATELSKWAEKLYVFQRTPASVDNRGQREFKQEDWDKIAAKPGWWRARNSNFVGHLNGEKPGEDLVNDAWTTIDTYKLLIGGPHEPVAMADIPQHITTALVTDAPRAERVRKRVEETVKDAETAEKLKAWYPSWCKRPCFHDEYLTIFNKPNVELVQTDPEGITKATPKGLVVGGKEYDVDVLVFGTGYRSPASDMSEPSTMCNASIVGKDGTNMRESWLAQGPTTLHGVLVPRFPNMFLTGPAQAGASASYTFLFDLLAEHVAHILAETTKRSKDPGNLVIEPTPEAVGAWTGTILSRATWASPLSICLPSYINDEGTLLKGDNARQLAQGGTFGEGINVFAKVLDEWRREGSLAGVTFE